MKSTKVRGLQSQVHYVLDAVISGGQEKSVSVEVPLYMRVDNSKFPPQNFTQDEEVGGYFGFKMTRSTNQFKINTSNVSPGDTIDINVSSDNSQCKHRIQCFKFKVFRRITYKMPNGREFKNCEYITYAKIDGCGKGESVEKNFSAIVPKLEADNKSKLCTSVVSNHLTVQYFVRCFVQYKSIFEAAVCQGHVVEFPIFVLPKPETEVQQSQPDQSFKVQGLPAEFDHEEDLADCFFQHKKENYWNTLGEPKLVNQWQVQLDFNDHRELYADE